MLLPGWSFLAFTTNCFLDSSINFVDQACNFMLENLDYSTLMLVGVMSIVVYAYISGSCMIWFL